MHTDRKRNLASLMPPRKTVGIVALVFITALVAVSTSAQEYVEIRAEVTQTNYNDYGSGQKQFSFPVTCIVGTNEWRIDERYGRGGESAWYYDGTNVYRSISTDQRPDAITIYISPSPDGHPLGDLGVNIPWLAFCSADYLKRAGRTIPVPVGHIPSEADSLGCVDKAETFPDKLGLPTLVELFTSRARYLSSLDDKRLYRTPWLLTARLHRARPSSLAEGMLRFCYRVEASTNFNGRHFPSKFTYLDYRPNYRTNAAGTWELVAEGWGKLIYIGPGTKPDSVFVANRMQTIVDARFRHPTRILDAIMYQWTNTGVPSTNDPRLKAEFKAAAERVGAASRKSTVWVRIPIFAILLVPPSYAAFKFLRRNHRRQAPQQSPCKAERAESVKA
jgi:hypothetical protein